MSLRSYAIGSVLVCSLFACSRLAPAADPPIPRSIVVPLRPPASWFASPPPPQLNAAEARNVQLWLNVAVHQNPDLLPIVVKLDALLHHPVNAGRVRNVGEARDILAGAIRALRYERGEIAPALSSQLFEGFKPPLPKISVPNELSSLSDKGINAAKDRAQKALDKRIPGLGLKEWTPLLEWIKKADKVGGQNYARTLYESDFAQKKKLLDDAWQRVWRPQLTLFIDDRALREAAARMRTAKPGSIAYELMNDAGPLSLQAPPMKPEEELRRDPRYKDELLAINAAKPISAANHPHLPATKTGSDRKELSPEDRKKIASPLVQAFKHYRKALDRNTAEMKELRMKLMIELPSELAKHHARQEAFRRERQQTIQDFQICASATLGLMPHLGVDPGTIRDLTAITNAAIGVWTGINMLTGVANSWNPAGWAMILGSVVSLFSAGPDAQQMMMEMLADIRRELADFRYETRLNFALLRDEMRDYAQKMLDRTADLEFNLSQLIRDVQQDVRWNEYRLGQVEWHIQAMRQEILNRLTELFQKDVVALLASLDLKAEQFADLATDKGSDLIQARYHDALTAIYTAAVHHATNKTLAGGDFRIPAVYGTVEPRLSSGSPRVLLPLVQDEAAPWSRINDFLAMAKDANIPVIDDRSSLGEPSLPAPTGRKSKPLLSPDRSKLINPAAWSLAAGAFLQFAQKGEPHFLRQPGYRHAFAEIYLRGEEFNDAMNKLAVAPQRGVFGRLLDAQLKAIADLEEDLSRGASEVSIRLSGGKVDPWAGVFQPLPKEGRYISWDGPTLTWQEEIRKDHFQIGDVTTADVPLEQKELARLIDEGHVAKAFVMATLITPFEGRGGTQKYFGGSLHLKVVNVEFPETPDNVRLRGTDRESTGLLGTGEGKYHDWIWYDGPAYLTFEVQYHPKSTGFYVVFRKRVPTRGHARFYKQDANNFMSWERAEEFETALRYRGHLMFYGAKKGFDATKFVKSQWAGLREDLFRKDPRWIVADPRRPLLKADEVEKAITDRLNFEMFEFQKDKEVALAAGLGRPGELIREIMGCQWLMYRYAQLALPECMSDAELIALLVGEQAAWAGTAVMIHFQLADPDNRQPLVHKAEADDHYKVPLTQSMRSQTLRLQIKLGELIDRRRAAAEQKEFVRHPAVEGMLLKYALTARRMRIDLQQELKNLGVMAQDHWACQRLEQYAKALPEDR